MNIHNIKKFICYMDECQDFDFHNRYYDVAACAADCFDIKTNSRTNSNIVFSRLLDIDLQVVIRIINGIGHIDPRLMIAKDVSFAIKAYIKTRTVQWPK